VGLDVGMEPLPGLSEGLFECIGSKPEAIFNVGYWASPQKYLVVDDSRAHFPPSELINDQGTFLKLAVTVGAFFGRDPSPGRASGLIDTPLGSGSQIFVKRGG
jgi:hypothetical protein